MARPKGSPKIPGSGRQKGQVGSKHWLVRNIVEEAMRGDSIPKRLIAMAKLNPDIEKEVLIALMPYCHPKLQAMEHSGAIDTGANQVMVDQLKNMVKELKEL